MSRQTRNQQVSTGHLWDPLNATISAAQTAGTVVSEIPAWRGEDRVSSFDPLSSPVSCLTPPPRPNLDAE